VRPSEPQWNREAEHVDPERLTPLTTHTVHQRPAHITFSLGLVNLPIFAPPPEQCGRGPKRDRNLGLQKSSRSLVLREWEGNVDGGVAVSTARCGVGSAGGGT